MGPSYSGMVWYPSQVRQNLQPNIQVPYYQAGQPVCYNQSQQPVQPSIPTPASGPIQQPGPSSPSTPPKTVVQTSVQPITPIPVVFTIPVTSAPQTSV